MEQRPALLCSHGGHIHEDRGTLEQQLEIENVLGRSLDRIRRVSQDRLLGGTAFSSLGARLEFIIGNISVTHYSEASPSHSSRDTFASHCHIHADSRALADESSHVREDVNTHINSGSLKTFADIVDFAPCCTRCPECLCSA